MYTYIQACIQVFICYITMHLINFSLLVVVLVVVSYLTHDPMDYSPPGSSVHGISLLTMVRKLETLCYLMANRWGNSGNSG